MGGRRPHRGRPGRNSKDHKSKISSFTPLHTYSNHPKPKPKPKPEKVTKEIIFPTTIFDKRSEEEEEEYRRQLEEDDEYEAGLDRAQERLETEARGLDEEGWPKYAGTLQGKIKFLPLSWSDIKYAA